MHRFYLPPEECADASFLLSEAETHHAAHVLRVKNGERLVVLNGAGAELLCEAKGLEKD
jgi:16S rRNA U1498 N3-methylase RsmE